MPRRNHIRRNGRKVSTVYNPNSFSALLLELGLCRAEQAERQKEK